MIQKHSESKDELVMAELAEHVENSFRENVEYIVSEVNSNEGSIESSSKSINCDSNETSLLQENSEHLTFNCDVCTKSFSDAKDLDSHKVTHMPKKNQKRVTFDAKEKLKSFKCSDCDGSFAFKRDLEIHSSIHAANGIYQCKECKKDFSSKCHEQRIWKHFQKMNYSSFCSPHQIETPRSYSFRIQAIHLHNL